MSDQNRPPPAYQEYAANMMAKQEYRLLNLQERGLLFSLRLECWVNRTLPENPACLAKVLGFDVAEVTAALPKILPFFAAQSGQIICPELEGYREHLDDRRARQAAGGKLGAATTNSKSKHKSAPDKASGAGVSTPASTSRLPRRGDIEPLAQQSKAQQSQNQLTKEDSSSDVDSWVRDYDKASNGG